MTDPSGATYDLDADLRSEGLVRWHYLGAIPAMSEDEIDRRGANRALRGVELSRFEMERVQRYLLQAVRELDEAIGSEGVALVGHVSAAAERTAAALRRLS